MTRFTLSILMSLVGLSVLLSHVTPASALASSGGATASVRLYFIAIGDGTGGGIRVGCGDRLASVVRPIIPTHAPLRAAYGLLLAERRRYYGQSGLYNALYQSRLKIGQIAVAGGRATVRLTGTLRQGGECDSPRIAAQLRQTALQFRTVRTVSILLNGRLLSAVLSLKG